MRTTPNALHQASRTTPAADPLHLWLQLHRLAGGTVTLISTATNTPSKPIHVGRGRLGGLAVGQIVITPNGKTAYATATTFCHTASCPVTVTPISTATNTPGKPIHVGGAEFQVVAITP